MSGSIGQGGAGGGGAEGRGPTVGALWASAFVLAALLVVQFGRSGGLGLGSAARAEVVSSVGGYTMLTFNGGSEDVLAVLDSRGEELFMYRVVNQNEFRFIGRESLGTMFTNARAVGARRN